MWAELHFKSKALINLNCCENLQRLGCWPFWVIFSLYDLFMLLWYAAKLRGLFICSLWTLQREAFGASWKRKAKGGLGGSSWLPRGQISSLPADLGQDFPLGSPVQGHSHHQDHQWRLESCAEGWGAGCGHGPIVHCSAATWLRHRLCAWP